MPSGKTNGSKVMSRVGLVSSLWERSETGKERRRYVITDAGRGAGEAWMSELANASALLHGLLKRYECGGLPEIPHRWSEEEVTAIEARVRAERPRGARARSSPACGQPF